MNEAKLLIERDKLARIKTSHVLHLLLSIITAGLWLPIWLLVAFSNVIERKRAERRIKKIVNSEGV